MKLMRSPVPLDRRHDVALITGDGRTSPGDIEKFLSWGVPHDVMCIGRSINLYPGEVGHWVNVDGADSKWWAEHLSKKCLKHTLGECAGYDCIWDDEQPDGTVWYGSTSYFAVQVALTMDYRKIVLAGCPLDTLGHWYFGEEHKGPTWRGDDYRVWLNFSQEDDAVKVRSMSGYTAMIVGQASKEWASK